jgi:uncharacterized LabA/DUF88 family protein
MSSPQLQRALLFNHKPKLPMSAVPQRIIFYVDGFNFYFGLKTKGWRKYYWLDMFKFCSQFIRPHQTLVEVNYFSAVPSSNKGKRDRQDLFFSANKSNPDFHLFLGKFLQKTVIHKECGKPYMTYEEKETDVHIATNMIRDVVIDRCDISVLISADSDLVPPIEFIKEYKPSHKIFVYFPPNRFSYDLTKKAVNIVKLENHESKFKTSLLDDEIKLSSGFVIKRPAHWN